MADANWVVALLLCFFLSWLGAHRFYTGRIGLGLWTLIDFILLLCGKLQDGKGNCVSNS
ncbi:NINE protein [Motilimonas pumila]|uniref:TM2 domain-containing protein n=1 Tax=Motilimonas pumila TaxID=2303987 RepID=A0A418YJP7_9GAMM|nr:TM2 domain-containing protein [Motilimonas pumila]RJG51209.1 TM2 domain-containing protein [Motilimonas pumila]